MCGPLPAPWKLAFSPGAKREIPKSIQDHWAVPVDLEGVIIHYGKLFYTSLFPGSREFKETIAQDWGAQKKTRSEGDMIRGQRLGNLDA